MATYVLSINVASSTISWATGTIDVAGGNRVLKCNKSTDVVSWSDAGERPAEATYGLLVCDSATDVVSWGDASSFGWSL